MAGEVFAPVGDPILLVSDGVYCSVDVQFAPVTVGTGEHIEAPEFDLRYLEMGSVERVEGETVG